MSIETLKSARHPVGNSVMGAISTRISQHSVQNTVLLVSVLISLDMQFNAGIGTYVFVDFFFPLLLAPLFFYSRFNRLRLGWEPAIALLPWLTVEVTATSYRTLDPHWFWGFSARFAMSILFAVAVRNTDGLKAAFFAALMTVPMSLYGAYQVATNGFGPLYPILNPHYLDRPWQSRATGFFTSDNLFGGFCAVLLPFLIVIAIRAQRRIVRVASTCVAAFCMLGLLESGSHGAALGFAVGMLYMMYFFPLSLGKKIGIVVAIGMAFGIGVIAGYAPALRLLNLNETTTVGPRLLLAATAVAMFLRHPLIGVGLTNFGQLVGGMTNNISFVGLSAHDSFLNQLAEGGVLGFVLFFGPIFYLLYKNIRASRRSPVALASASALLIFLAHGATDYLLGEPQYLYLFMLVIGTSCSVYDMSRVKRVTPIENEGYIRRDSRTLR